MSATQLCFVRHGETDWNAQRRLQGQTDTPLNAKGLAQAAAAATALARHKFHAVFSSDLSRARNTAEIIANRLSLPVHARSALRERHYGIFTGLNYDEAEARYPAEFEKFRTRDPDFNVVGGESLHTLAERVRQCVNNMVAAHPGQTVLVVAHGGVLDIVHRMVTRQPLEAPRDFAISNAALNWLECFRGHWRMLTWNELPSTAEALDELPN